MPAYKNKDNGTWFVQFRYSNWKGETIRKTKRGFETRKEALEWEREFLLKYGGSLDMPFKDFAEIYLEHIENRVKQRSYMSKDYLIRKELIPYFGEIPVSEITKRIIVQWQDEMIKKRNAKTGELLSRNYLDAVSDQLSCIFSYAEKYYDLKMNPARAVGPIKTNRRKPQMKFWTLDEYKKFIEQVMDKPKSYYAFQILYWTGMREGELLALTPEDFNFKNKYVSINKTYFKKNGKEYMTAPKTDAGERVIGLPKFLVDEVKDYLRMNPQIQSNQRMFTFSSCYLRTEIKRGADLAGLHRIRVHDLRHSHVSLLINRGFTAVSIAQRLGHRSVDVTYQYAHMFPDIQEKVIKELERARKGA